jgi:tRNA/tmRNA/rRNA uracil-C5-methylase (TrmA/RlmC/RlmD family)
MSEFRKKPERPRPGAKVPRPAPKAEKPVVAIKNDAARGHDDAPDSLFDQLLQKAAGAEAALRHGRRMLAEPFAPLAYSRELEIKNRAFASLCAQSGLPVPESVIAAPQPRHYRTTTKRRMVWSKARPDLIVEGNPYSPMSSALEPESHTSLFSSACDLLTAKTNRKLAGDLNYVIIREDRRGLLLLFNIARIDAAIVRQYRALSAQLAQEHRLAGTSLYHDPTRSEYYLEAHAEDGAPQLKHLSGIKTLQQNIGGLDYECALTGFSQVNHPVAAIMRDLAATMLEPQPGSHLADLYCGNGFFSKALAVNIFFGVRYGL